MNAFILVPNFHSIAPFSADGSKIASVSDLPIQPSVAQVVYDAKASRAGKGWIWDVATDKVKNTSAWSKNLDTFRP